ncbi:MAG TPA: hypothetical protein VFC70_00535 [Oscillospiraceae bacterium]|nr:hypothetical protein [Oscillospiraceae bacterium]
MKRILLIALLVVSMLAVVGFTPVEASYWDEVKEIYKWDAMEGKSETEFSISVPDMDIDCQYKIYVNSQSSFDDFSSYSEIKVEDIQGQINIPVIKMYVHNSDIYINKEAVLALLSALNVDDVEIEEEFVMLENDQNDIEIDFNKMLDDIIGFIDEMDLGMDFNITKRGSTYTLTLESDELIDFLDAYIRYFIENIDQMPDSLTQGQKIEITEEEKQEALDEYDTFIDEYKDLAKLFIKGSKYHMESKFEKDKYSENSQIKILFKGIPDVGIPTGELNMNTVSTTLKLKTSGIELPTSVMKITAEELQELLMSQMDVEEKFVNEGLKAIIELDGSYAKFSKSGLEKGQIPLKVEDGKAYITIEDAEKLFDVKLEGLDDPFHIRQLDNYGFCVEWNDDLRIVEIY